MGIFYGVHVTHEFDQMKKEHVQILPPEQWGMSNIFRPVLFQLCPNVVEMELESSICHFDARSLLSVLEQCSFGSCFKSLKIIERRRTLLDAIVSIKESFTEKGMFVLGCDHFILVLRGDNE